MLADPEEDVQHRGERFFVGDEKGRKSTINGGKKPYPGTNLLIIQEGEPERGKLSFKGFSQESTMVVTVYQVRKGKREDVGGPSIHINQVGAKVERRGQFGNPLNCKMTKGGGGKTKRIFVFLSGTVNIRGSSRLVTKEKRAGRGKNVEIHM